MSGFKVGVIIFVSAVILFVMFSSALYFNNNSNIELKIKTNVQVNREISAVNEAITQSLIQKSDSIIDLHKVIKRKDSASTTKLNYVHFQLRKVQYERDSLKKLIRRLVQSDIEPVSKPTN